MAIPLADNLNYQGRKPDFARQQYATFADMAAVKKSKMPEMYLAYCLEDRAYYLYDKSNEPDAVLGLWRKFEPGADIQVTELPRPSVVFMGKCVQYLGPSTERYRHGCFYECVLRESEYVWHLVNLVDINSIPIEEIDELFGNE